MSSSLFRCLFLASRKGFMTWSLGRGLSALGSSLINRKKANHEPRYRWGLLRKVGDSISLNIESSIFIALSARGIGRGVAGGVIG